MYLQFTTVYQARILFSTQLELNVEIEIVLLKSLELILHLFSGMTRSGTELS